MDDDEQRELMVLELESLLERARAGTVLGVSYVAICEGEDPPQMMEYEYIVTSECDITKLLGGMTEQQSRFAAWIVAIRESASRKGQIN